MMKRLFITLLLCLALLSVTTAAPAELKGLLSTVLEYRPETPLDGTTFLDLALEGQAGKKLNGVFGLQLYPVSVLASRNWYDDLMLIAIFPYAYVEAEGALWEGAEPIKLSMGSIDVKYSPYVAWFGYNTRIYLEDFEDEPFWIYYNINGITVDNVRLGKVTTRGFYAFSDGNEPDGWNVVGANFKGSFDELDFDATFVKGGELLAYDVSASLTPVKDLKLSGQFISDGEAEEGWYKFATSYTGIPNWKLGAAYRDFSTPLDLLGLRDTTPPVVDGSFVMPNPYYLNEGLKGLILNAATNYEGYDLSGEYDYALRMTSLTAARDSWSAKLKLFYPLGEEEGFGDEVESLVVFRGSTTSDVAFLKNVEFEGVAEFGKEAVYGGSATYKAPGGLKVVAEYYSGDLQDDNGLGWIQEKGLAIRAGYSVNF